MTEFLSTLAAWGSIALFNASVIAFYALDAELYRRRRATERKETT